MANEPRVILKDLTQSRKVCEMGSFFVTPSFLRLFRWHHTDGNCCRQTRYIVRWKHRRPSDVAPRKDRRTIITRERASRPIISNLPRFSCTVVWRIGFFWSLGATSRKLKVSGSDFRLSSHVTFGCQFIVEKPLTRSYPTGFSSRVASIFRPRVEESPHSKRVVLVRLSVQTPALQNKLTELPLTGPTAASLYSYPILIHSNKSNA